MHSGYGLEKSFHYLCDHYGIHSQSRLSGIYDWYILAYSGQKIYLGASRGTYGQVVKAIKAAAYHNIRGKVEVFEAEKFQAAFERGRQCKSTLSVALKY